MIRHYLKIAFRNLKKYRLQSVISIIGLAIGFACFALSTLWIRYEMTYDTFRKDADRLYLVRIESNTDNRGISEITPYPLARYLKETFPEIENACNTNAWKTEFTYKEKKYESFEMTIDSVAERIFEIELINGSKDYMIPESGKIAITDKLAREIFGNTNPLGEKIKVWSDELEICAIVKSQNPHSNFPFGLLREPRPRDAWNVASWKTFVVLRSGTQVESFKKKLYEHKIEQGDKGRDKMCQIILTPLTTIRYDRPSEEPTVKFEHIQLFALSGGLVILCALFNYLTLFANRIRIRNREIGLRKVCGSSNGNLLGLFAFEYLMTLLLAFFLGLVLIEVIQPSFKELSNVHTETMGLFLETMIYFGAITLLSFLFSLFPIYYFRKQSLQKALKGSFGGRKRSLFPKISLSLQLIICIGFIFCSSLLVKQIHHLNTTDLGLERLNRGNVSVYPMTEGLKEEAAKLSAIAEIFPGEHQVLFPCRSSYWRTFNSWDEKPASAKEITMQQFSCNQHYFDFYGLKLIKGKMPADNTEGHILINEAAIKELGIDNPIGKTISREGQDGFVIDGVIKDFYIAPPTVPAKPIMLIFDDSRVHANKYSTDFIFCHQPGSKELCKTQLEQLIKKMNPNALDFRITFMEEEYEKFLKSENALLKMLDFVTVICILISLFGVFSQVTLDCERRRKEIAVRKVNGATVKSITQLFFATNLRLLCLASVIAFPVSYLIMKSWVENYTLQTDISWWLYPLIWIGLALLLTGSTAWRIRRAANQNPAEVIKSE